MLFSLDGTDPDTPFPPASMAESDPDGLLAIGGDLSETRLLNAYRAGIFPWFSDQQPLLWWSPDPRTLLFPDRLHVSRSLRKTLRREIFHVTFDTAFEQVIRHCALIPRTGQNGTWITDEMLQAYCALHRQGQAHSVEVWHEGELAGGLYGVAIGAAFYGESMFSRRRDASKIALVKLVDKLAAAGFLFIDCQVVTDHLLSLGAETVDRTAFLGINSQAVETAVTIDWKQTGETDPQ
ncbi:MAG: leucyl/phenylalanyl-tRNA--protein transferase [Sedimenticolaceae bacterium]|nr:leucyl/phenylalanyl-tRNA--protein transferase [Sedimenticolaceae bacterium]